MGNESLDDWETLSHENSGAYYTHALGWLHRGAVSLKGERHSSFCFVHEKS